MQWYEPKEKTAAIDWRCDTDFYHFKIISINNDNLGLYRISKHREDYLIEISKDMNELFYYAYDLQLMRERRERKNGLR